MPKRSFSRTDRLSAQFRRELGVMVHEAVREHSLPSASVSDVEVTRDLSHAKVWVTALQPEKSAEVVKALTELAKGFRQTLGRTLRIRQVPELHFHYDASVDRGEKIGLLLKAAAVQDAASRAVAGEAGPVDDTHSAD
ncbi:MAG: 30S ribosome-binding factor RbfA [Lysobacteraceae bacterium]